MIKTSGAAKSVIWDDISILVVDDSKVARHVICDMLRKMKIGRIFEAEDDAEALEFTRTASDIAHLVICDWNMPKMDGIEFFKQMRIMQPKLSFLMVTGRNDAQSVSEAKAAGITHYILKPFSITDLKSKITSILT